MEWVVRKVVTGIPKLLSTTSFSSSKDSTTLRRNFNGTMCLLGKFLALCCVQWFPRGITDTLKSTRNGNGISANYVNTKCFVQRLFGYDWKCSRVGKNSIQFMVSLRKSVIFVSNIGCVVHLILSRLDWIPTHSVGLFRSSLQLRERGLIVFI